MSEPTKTCKDCGENKSVGAYYRYRRECKTCTSRRNLRRPNRAVTQRRANLKFLYGISEDRYAEMLRQQEGRCAICSKPPEGRRLAVDHDHRTRVVRGLLCARCNLLLGKAQDSPEILLRAAEYLARAR